MDDLDTETEVELSEPPNLSLDDVSALEEKKKVLKESFVVPYREDRYSDFGASGAIFHGTSGTGKTHLAECLIGELGFDCIHKPTLDSYDATETLRQIHEKALESQPCVVFIENLELIASSGIFEESEVTVDEQEIAVLNEMLDDFDDAENAVIFLATTSNLSGLHRAVRRTGRIDLTMEVGLPDAERRRKVIKDELRDSSDDGVSPSFEGVDQEAFDDASDGLTTADVVEVAERVARESFSHDGEIDVEQEALVEAVTEVREEADDPTSDSTEEADTTVEEEPEMPEIGYDDVGGLEKPKRLLKEAIEWPRKHPDLTDSFDIDSSKGILLHGPPGNGKTLLAKAVANETDSTFVSVNGPEIYDSYVGESEGNIRRIFERAREEAPAVVFIDEIDSLAGKRDFVDSTAVYAHVVNQLLSEMDGLEELEDVVVIGATNNASSMDPAVLRPGRFDRKILVDQPDEEGRKEIFEVHTEGRDLADDVTTEWLVKNTDDTYSGAEIEAVCEEAAMSAMRRCVEDDIEETEMKREDFERAFRRRTQKQDKEPSDAFV